MRSILMNILAMLILAAAFLPPASAAEDAATPKSRILVDTAALTLTLLQGDKIQLNFSEISIGRFGATSNKRRGDNMTPLGEFRIAWIKPDSRFHGFLGLDYPDLPHAERALAAGLIGRRDWHRIRDAHSRGELPPQDTPLGGQIGIHGVGAGDPAFHARFNWTNGCIALTNEQMDQLIPWVVLGTRVLIR